MDIDRKMIVDIGKTLEQRGYIDSADVQQYIRSQDKEKIVPPDVIEFSLDMLAEAGFLEVVSGDVDTACVYGRYVPKPKCKKKNETARKPWGSGIKNPWLGPNIIEE